MFTQLPYKNAGNVSVTLTIPNFSKKKKYLDTQSQATELHDRANKLNVGYQNTMISTPSDPQKKRFNINNQRFNTLYCYNDYC